MNTFIGSGALNIQGNTTFTGDTLINNIGGLSIDTLGQLGGGNYTGSISLNGNSLAINTSLDQRISGNITGIGSVSKSSTGRVTLTGLNTYSSGTTLFNGNLVLGSSSALGTGQLIVSGGTLDTIAANIAINNALSVGSNLTFWGTGNLTQSAGNISLNNSNTTINVVTAGRVLKLEGDISGASNLTKMGSGSLSLSSNNTFTDVVVIGGNLVLESSAALPDVSGFTLNGGSLASYINIAKDITLSSGSLIGNSVVSANITIADILSNSLVANSGNLVVNTLILSGQATFTASETSKVLVSNLTNTLSNVSSRYINLNVVGSLTNGFKDAFIYGNNTVELNDFNLNSVPNLGTNQVALLQQSNSSIGVLVTSY
jgi:hypothetical protein